MLSGAKNVCFGAKKTLKSCHFLSFGETCWNCIFNLPRSRAFQQRTARPRAAEKSGSSHLFVVVAARAGKKAYELEWSKAIFFCLTSYPDAIAHSNSADWELLNDLRLVKLRQRKVALTPVHTLCYVEPDEGLFAPLWRVVEIQPRGH